METRSSEVAAVLQRKVHEAEVAYQRAREEYQRLMTVARATANPSDPGLVDGQHAVVRALRIHCFARRKYEDALRQFTEFILNGRPPEGE